MQNHVDAETLAGFVEEVRSYLPQILSAVEQFAADPSRAESIEVAHRHVHTIRGAAAMVGLDDISRMLDPFEASLADVGPGKAPLGAEALERFRRTCRAVELYLNEVAADHLTPPTPPPDPPAPPPEAAPSSDDLDELFALVEKAPAPATPPPPRPETPAADEEDRPDEVPPELVEVFTLEAEDHLRTLHTLLPVLRQQPDQKDVLQEIRRSAHTLKGSAAMVGFHRITQLAHRMEDLLDPLYDGRLAASPEVIELLVASADALHDLAGGKADPQALKGLYACYDDLLGTAPAAAAGPREPGDNPDAAAAVIERFLRVPSERLDDLIKLVSELVINRSGFEQRLAALARQLAELQ